MSTEPQEAPAAAPWRRVLGLGKLPPLAATYLVVVTLTAVVAGGLALARLRPDTAGWGLFLLLLALAATAQLFIVEIPASRERAGKSYRMAIVFLVAGAILLPPPFVVLVSALHYVPGWFKHKKSGIVRVFNVCNTALAALAAWLAFDRAGSGGDLRYVAGGIAACAVFVAVNHIFLALMIRFASGTSLRDTRLFSFESLSTDFALGALGLGVAVAWMANPWSIGFVITPLLLVYRSLLVPQLQVEAKVDPKTGLLNAREYQVVLDDEIERAERTGVPLSLLMADLDFLRDINNTHGHLAGDAVIKGIADAIRGQLRRYDVASRFGGEEFSVILPSTEPGQAVEIAERIRRAVADSRFEDDTVVGPLSATISIGVAGFPRDARDAKGLVHQADVAVYQAKEGGRNRVVEFAGDDDSAADAAAAG